MGAGGPGRWNWKRLVASKLIFLTLIFAYQHMAFIHICRSLPVRPQAFKNGISVVRRCHKFYGNGLPLTLTRGEGPKPSPRTRMEK